MTVLVFGASGLLGGNVAVAARERGLDVVGTYHTNDPDIGVDCEQCDITNEDALRTAFDRHDPSFVLNCAALTDVDACEANPDAARSVNSDAPARMAALCERRGAELVHVSTDYVFDGTTDRPYTVDDPTDPIQEYGASKRAGETAVVTNATDALVARLSFVYGIHQSTGELDGLPAWVSTELQAGNEIPLFTDQYVTPTRAGQAAETLLNLVGANASGLFHVASRDCVTPHWFGKLIAQRLGVTGLIDEGIRADVDRPAPRPAYTCLDVSKVEDELGRPQPTLGTDLDQIDLGQN